MNSEMEALSLLCRLLRSFALLTAERGCVTEYNWRGYFKIKNRDELAAKRGGVPMPSTMFQAIGKQTRAALRTSSAAAVALMITAMAPSHAQSSLRLWVVPVTPHLPMKIAVEKGFF